MDDNLDPNLNHVTFHLERDGEQLTLTGVGPARAVDCISAIWQVFARDNGAKAAEVWQVYSEWEPAAEDLAFLDETFREDAELGYTFRRPKDHGWPAALAAAAKVIAASDSRKGCR